MAAERGLTELELIRRIGRAAGEVRSPRVRLGIGDDCAILAVPAGHEVLVTTDLSLEGRHFRRDWHSPESAGHRTLARGLSDLAAMGGRPLAAFLSLALPKGFDPRWVDGFLKGFLALAKRHGTPLAGGDTAQAQGAEILADIVLLGSAKRGKALRRSGARVGDRVFVTGALGGSAAQLERMMAGERCGTGLGPVSASGQAWTQPRVAGSVPVSEATATGVLMVSGSRNVLGDASVVTALDRPAHVSLERGGGVLVCQTSVLHLTESQMGPADALTRDWSPRVLLALDRGAMEIRMPISGGDAVMTPDLRFTSMTGKGKSDPLDLAVRVTTNGDTCVENRGKKAPTLYITDAFGESVYQLKAAQHVMFEHGSLKEVNDRETTPCGCPPLAQQEISLAEAAIRSGSTRPVTPKKAAQQHPFPAAVSEGMAPIGTVPAEGAGTHVQVASTLSYDPEGEKPVPAGTQSAPAAHDAAPAQVIPAAQTGAQPAAQTGAQTGAQPKPKAAGGFHALGGFFKRIFGR